MTQYANTEYIAPEPKSDPFHHVKNIVVGQARVIYAQCAYTHGWAWMLPGCRSTIDWNTAHDYAHRMNAIMGGVK